MDVKIICIVTIMETLTTEGTGCYIQDKFNVPLSANVIVLLNPCKF